MPDNDIIFSSSDEDEGGGEWILTFGDMMSLLLCFFIMLFALSDVDPKKSDATFVSLNQALGGSEKVQASASRIQTQEASLIETAKMQKSLVQAQKKVFSDIRTFLNTKGVEGVVSSVFDEGVITLRMPSGVLFDPGEVDLKPEGMKLLLSMKDLFMQRNDQNINIKGYTDDVPPREGGRFRDNWEISALRAVNVLRFMLRLGVEPVRLTATGLADLDPLYPNTSDENRAQNRRVEFVLEKRVTR